jgi:hypothetical protein
LRKDALKAKGNSPVFSINGKEYLLNRLRKKTSKKFLMSEPMLVKWTRIALARLPQAHVLGFEISQKTFSTSQDNLKSEYRVALHSFGLSNDSALI